jgi:hypothetical protein
MTHPIWDDYTAESASNDSLMSDLEARIIALEEAVTSRRARRRLARSIREACKTYQWAGSFFAARLESTTYEWLNGPRWRDEARKGGAVIRENRIEATNTGSNNSGGKTRIARLYPRMDQDHQ